MSSPELHGRLGLKPDMIIYPSDLPSDLYTRPAYPKVKSKDDVSRPSFANFGFAELIWEVKQIDPFFDPRLADSNRDTHDFVLEHIGNATLRDQATKDLGQNIAYAIELNKRQYRSFCFSIYVAGKQARLLRWDRAGAIVSESFDYTLDSGNFLVDFIWRYVHAGARDRGYDTSVKPAKPKQDRLFRDTIRRRLELDVSHGAVSLPDGVGKKLEEHYKEDHVVSMKVGEDTFLACVPVVSPEGLATRGTRGYWVVSLATEKVMFLKDTWRYNVASMEKEGDILGRLNAQSIPNISTLCQHGDVPGESAVL
jgi:hypothetical protein